MSSSTKFAYEPYSATSTDYEYSNYVWTYSHQFQYDIGHKSQPS